MYSRTCTACGNEFETNTYQQKKCRRDCGRLNANAARAQKRLTNDITFIGVDGEGVDRPDGKHEYVMLSVGDHTLWQDGNALTLDAILSFLYEQYLEEPNAAYVGFFLGYDFIQWEKLLPEREARLLLTEKGIAERKSRSKLRANPYPDAVVWEGWEIDIMAGRRFKLRPHVHHRSEYNGLCRNRTCRKVMAPESGTPSIIDGEPGTLIPGETEWTIPVGDHATEYDGDPSLFWEFYAPARQHVVGRGDVKAKAYGWMYICDTGPFWQTSFLNVINPENWEGKAVCTDEEFSTVVRGKADRGTIAEYGDNSYFEEMQRYNVLENDILGRVTTRLNQGFMNDRIPIKIPKTDWYGPGRAAQLWMDQLHYACSDPAAREANKTRLRNPELAMERANETGLLNADIYMSMPTWYYDAAQASYYGGWFEQFMHGHIGDVWEYDINSAYPYIIASLPCLHTTGVHNGTYTQGDGSDYPHGEGRYTLLYATVRGSNPYIGAMPYRSKSGLISRPQETKGWYWAHEIDAAKRAGLIDTVEVDKWASYLACDCPPPFDPPTIGISRLYQARLDFGKNTPQGKSAKLVYNSAYGKTAQSIGQPKYSNPVYASLITAGCRTLILEAIESHPDGASACTMVATDGVYFTRPHPGLLLDRELLGAWDETFKAGMTQLMPGVYWDDKTRELLKDGKSPKLKSRGVNARDLAAQIERLDFLFAQAHLELKNGGIYEWPEITFTVGFLLDSAKIALQRGKWDIAGKVTHNATRKISSNPSSKRNPEAYRDNGSAGLTRTRPYTAYDKLNSTPYSESFGYGQEDGLGSMFPGSIGRDGDDGMQYFRDLINGTV